MDFWRRCCLLCLVCCFCFCGFGIGVHAADNIQADVDAGISTMSLVDVDGYTATYAWRYSDLNTWNTVSGSSWSVPNTSKTIDISVRFTLPSEISRGTNMDLRAYFTSTGIKISNLVPDQLSGWDKSWTYAFGNINYPDIPYKISGSTLQIDVVDVCNDRAGLTYISLYFLGVPVSSSSVSMSCTDFAVQQVADNTLLSGILGWVQSIYNSIVSLPAAISSGIHDLFVPSAADIDDFVSGFKSILSTRFGAIYEAVVLVDDYISDIMTASEQSTISMPAVTVALAGTDFSFGGYTVDIVPSGYDLLLDALKLIIDIISTFSVLVMLYRKFESEVVR